jgi:hypothetical protein
MVGFLGFVCAAIPGRPMMKFESGFTVETVFDGSKLGIEPYSVEVLPSGELLILDSANSNLYRISASLSLCKWVAWKYCLVHLVSLDSFVFLLEIVVLGVFFC